MTLPISLECGDLLAFSGTGFFSNVIKWTTDPGRREISHVAVMTNENTLVEATTLGGENGVSYQNLEHKLATYPGAIWALPMTKAAREYFDEKRFRTFLYMSNQSKYSKLQAFLAPLGAGDNLHNWASNWYCSKLCAGAYIEGGVLPVTYDISCTPAKLTKAWIFDKMILLKEKDAKK